MMLDYLALFFLIFASVAIFYAIIAIHDIPYEIAKKRNHPHLEAIHYAGWVSLFTLHVIWPFLWIWATLWQKDEGWGSNGNSQAGNDRLLQVEKRNLELETQLNDLQQQLQKINEKLATFERPKLTTEGEN